MVQNIRVLDKKTINQIAAGEVVERPASVVKELLENSIDANSTKIVIELKAAGKKLIRITDNGDGIAPDEIKLAFEKHSTSKIGSIQDLDKLQTLGFRGEALASISAVARIECISCDGKHLPGRKLVIEGGSTRNLSEIGCAKGTTIKVKDLFYNLPARLKYMKSDQTELSHVIDVVTHLAIYHTRINFKLFHNENELLNLPATNNQLNNLVNIYGKELVRNLVPVSKIEPTEDLTQDQMELRITGYIGKPSLTRSDSSYQSIYINGRYVENRLLSDAIKEAYRSLVMKHRHPFVILFIDIEPKAVDVNISPTKIHVRFEKEKQIFKNILKSLQDTLRSYDLIPEVTPGGKSQPVSLKAITMFGTGKPGYLKSLPAEHNQFAKASSTNQRANDISQFSKYYNTQQRILEPADKIQKTNKQSTSVPRADSGSTLPFMQPIGQIMDTYILAQASDNMLIIDQHAAHERIMYERIKTKYTSNTMSTQELLDPVALELSPKEVGLLENNIETLRELNFIIDALGTNSYYVKGIPIILGKVQEPEFIHDIINDLISIKKEKELEIIKDKMIQVMACKSAIKAGKSLEMPEILQLIAELYSIENPYTCAHGRPTIISVTENQLKKMFKRIV